LDGAVTGIGHRIFLAAAGITGRRFGVVVASSLIATSMIISAALTAGGHGPLAGLLGTASGQTSSASNASSSSSSPSSPPPPRTASAKSAPQAVPPPQHVVPPPTTAPPPTTTPPPKSRKPPKTPNAPTPPTAKLGKVKHVFVITLSSPGYDQTFGSQSQMPYLAKTLRPKGELLSGYSLLTTQGLPNYIAATGGQAPNKLTKKDCPKYAEFPVGTSPNRYGLVSGAGCVYPAETLTLPDQLASGGLLWRGYMEGMADTTGQPHSCVHPGTDEADQPSRGGYAARLNPFVYFHSLLDLGSCALNDVPLDGVPSLSITGLQDDLKKASTTPTYSFISPNLCHDGIQGQCQQGADGAASADAFLADWVPRILNSPAYADGGLLIITFGEAHPSNGTSDPKHVGTILLSSFVTPGATDSGSYDPYSMLRSLEDLFTAAHLGYANAADGTSFAPDLLGSGD
jgi:hypothetical protein